ncbi:hypothetical protein DVH24_017874 [Malus domestica]|uniref:Uncharacterized protein n=1 Tax=Malus domestica TaxID=3750 RepID=A0A498KJP7_MALDO|nr:hypothetical protein DVH24_017874 [Malus domestica]
MIERLLSDRIINVVNSGSLMSHPGPGSITSRARSTTVAQYCPFWAPTTPSRFCLWELTREPPSGSPIMGVLLRATRLTSDPCPTRIAIRKSSHLLGPKFLQIAWVIDVAKFRLEDFTRNSRSRRLLELGLRDGHGEVAAEEYSHIPATPDDVVPGTKFVRLMVKKT